MLINNLIRGGDSLNRLLLRTVPPLLQKQQAGYMFIFGKNSLNIDKFVEFDKLDLYGLHYEDT